MEFRLTQEQESFRKEVQGWLQQVLPRFQVGLDFIGHSDVESEDTRYSPAFSRELGRKGWIGVAWPRQYGGQGLGFIEQMVFNEEMVRNRAPCGYHILSEKQMGPSILQHGSDEQRSEFIPRVFSGDIGFAVGYTEPNTGSDLAGLETHARRDGDDYVINGQKMWAGGAHFAEYLWTAVRTNPEAPKHRGVSVFLVPLKGTPGLTIRPFYGMSGARYNEVFFENVRVPAAAMVGEKDRGWYTVAHNLDFERSGIERVVQGEMQWEEIVQAARELRCVGVSSLRRSVIAHKLADIRTDYQVARNLAYRVGWMQSQGEVPNHPASVSKLYTSEVGQRAWRVYMQALGYHGTLEREARRAVLRGKPLRKFLDSVANTIRAGTSEVQRNIIATRGLGLPR